MPVAFGRPLAAAFVAPGADHRGGFGLDELLEDETHGIADEVDAVA